MVTKKFRKVVSPMGIDFFFIMSLALILMSFGFYLYAYFSPMSTIDLGMGYFFSGAVFTASIWSISYYFNERKVHWEETKDYD